MSKVEYRNKMIACIVACSGHVYYVGYFNKMFLEAAMAECRFLFILQ